MDSKKYTESLTWPFPEFERIARNRPHPKIDAAYPKVTDGTTASIIRKTPHRIIQQLPTGQVEQFANHEVEDWLLVVANFIYKNKIIPYANAEYSLINKCWAMVEKALSFGGAIIYTPFLNHDGYYCSDMSLPYWGDCFFQPGKKSYYDSNYFFLRSWWRQEDIEALIDKESKLSKKSKKRGEQYQSSWDIGALQKIKDSTSSKDVKAQTPSERERQNNPVVAVELITGFQKGVEAPFYTFHYNTNTVVRTQVNKDPRGIPPIDAMYGDTDGSNPLGRSVIEQVGGLQNLMDAEMQMYQYNRALMLNPPLIKRGTFNRNKIKFAPNVVIDVGSDANANVEPLTVDTTAIANFANNYGLMKSQLLYLVGSPDTSVGSQAGNPSNSKTSQGVQATTAALSIDDNFLRKQFESAFGRWSETAINRYFAEREGVEVLQLDEETAEVLQNMPGFDTGTLNEQNQIKINYSSATPALKFRVDASSSQMKNDPMQMQIAENLLQTVMANPMLDKRFGGRIDPDELAERIVYASAINDPEEVAPELTQKEKQAKQQAKNQINPFSPLFDKPHISIDYGDVEDPQSRAQLLQLAGAAPGAPLAPISPKLAENAARNIAQVLPEEQTQQPDPNAPPPIDPNAQIATPDHLLKAQDQAHNQQMERTEMALKIHQANNPAQTNKETGQTKVTKQFVPPSQPAPQQPQQPQQPQAPQPQQGITAADQPTIEALQKAGASAQQIGQALAMLHHGYSEQEVLKMLGVA